MRVMKLKDDGMFIAPSIRISLIEMSHMCSQIIKPSEFEIYLRGLDIEQTKTVG